ncbi:hypothetical protein QFZ20_005491 [Flavobacterium sp. W4I14]|nr:hypothetical protein [Flavobacterium sp. W4I14]
MNWFKNMGGFFGYIIGAAIILPLLLIGYNYFFINKNEAEKYISSYLNNFSELKIIIPEAKSVEEFMSIKSKTIAMRSKNMGRDGSSRTTMMYRLAYDQTTRKYFQITMFDLYNQFFGAIDNKKVLIKVNKQDLNNPTYGTKEKPIPVFSVRGADKPLTEHRATDQDLAGSDYNIDTTPDWYKYNVYMYLTYIMPKEEFEKRFGKN